MAALFIKVNNQLYKGVLNTVIFGKRVERKNVNKT